MASKPDIVEVACQGSVGQNLEWLPRAESVHRELRPHLPADYAEKMKRVLQDARMALAVQGDEVLGLAVYRWHENTFDGLKFYVDDLVTTERRRSQGVGTALLAHLEQVARSLGASGLVLDSGTQRTRAHKFYFREGFVINSFNFKKSLI
jgi:GNAT superfamily N-acetyltransferase